MLKINLCMKIEITLGELFEEWKISNHVNNIKTQQVYNSYVNSFSTTFSTLLNKSLYS